jgi:hypothetical protein
MVENETLNKTKKHLKKRKKRKKKQKRKRNPQFRNSTDSALVVLVLLL